MINKDYSRTERAHLKVKTLFVKAFVEEREAVKAQLAFDRPNKILVLELDRPCLNWKCVKFELRRPGPIIFGPEFESRTTGYHSKPPYGVKAPVWSHWLEKIVRPIWRWIL